MGLGRLAGAGLKAFASGIEGTKVAANAASLINKGARTQKALEMLNRAGQFQSSTTGNYLINTAMDAGMGMVWGESPLNAVGRSAIGNIGGTAAQKLFTAGADKVGMPRMATEAIANMVVNPAAYTGMEMLGSRVVPGLYGLDANGNYIGNQAEAPLPQIPTDSIGVMPVNPQMGGPLDQLSEAERFKLRSDMYLKQQRESERAMKQAATNAYKARLESSNNVSLIGQQYGLAPVPPAQYGGMY